MLLKLSLSALAMGLRFGTAVAQDKKTVRLVVGFPAASISDIVARLIAPYIGAALDRHAMVDVKSGAD